MKYIKKYEGYSDISDNINDIKELFFELEDMGFNAYVSSSDYGNQYQIRIRKVGGDAENQHFSFNEIEEYVDRMVEYSNLNKYKLSFIIDHFSWILKAVDKYDLSYEDLLKVVDKKSKTALKRLSDGKDVYPKIGDKLRTIYINCELQK